MTRNYLLGAAAAALSVVALSGTAQAADVMPVIPVVTPVVVPVPGPVFEINIEHWVNFGLLAADFDPETFTEVDLKVTLPSGLGFELIGDTYVDIDFGPLDLDFAFATVGRVFKTMGDFEVGAYAGVGIDPPGPPLFPFFGFDFAYDTDKLTVENYVQANFVGLGFLFLDVETDVTVHLTDKLDIYGNVDFETDFATFFLGGYVGVQYDFGLLAPYATVWLDGGPGFEIGVELEHQFGTGPLSLLGYAELEFDGGGPEAYVGIGIKYSRGGE